MTKEGPEPSMRWEFTVKGELPRWVPYIRTRYRTFVDAPTKKWRKKVARACKRHGVVKPLKGQKVMLHVQFTMLDGSRPDNDSLYHSLQDAVSKDHLHMADKDWGGSFLPPKLTKGKSTQRAEIRLEYY